MYLGVSENNSSRAIRSVRCGIAFGVKMQRFPKQLIVEQQSRPAIDAKLNLNKEKYIDSSLTLAGGENVSVPNNPNANCKKNTQPNKK